MCANPFYIEPATCSRWITITTPWIAFGPNSQTGGSGQDPEVGASFGRWMTGLNRVARVMDLL